MHISTLLPLSLLALPVLGTPLFQNPGTITGWDETPVPEHDGTISEVSNIFYKGPTALKMTQTYDSSYSGRYHSEVKKYNVEKRGDEGFYGFAFRLHSEWDFQGTQSYDISQFIADFSNTGCDDYMPSTMIYLRGNQLATRRKYGDVCPKSAQKTEAFENLATVSAGTWHRIVVQARWRSDNTGFLKLWFDGTKVLEKFDVATTVTDGRAFQFRVGLYANAWFDEKRLVGSGDRQVWFDSIGAGSEFKDADPDQWS
ncbi:hypothetical protein HYFRA_00000669 [Hymenoscyphus fraxineus]|uniref:Polysaccharide lyase family 20 protein n=1 Tax=Hymenoscyphus fraxineus TaxID=746836 RepID=A0A9N9PWY8_9HELO|nr:hypothetical protein HYFRA_00000669 [Hymenoscyphus fraxineus]